MVIDRTIKKNAYSLIKILSLFLLILFCLIFPAADLFISKKLLFAVNMFFVFLDGLLYKRKITNSVILIRIFILLSIVITFSIPTFAPYPAEVQFLIVSCITIFVIFAAYDKKIIFFKCFIISSNILAILTVFIALLSLYSKVIVLAVDSIFISLKSGFLGQRNFGGLELIMVHFRTAPILIISSSYYFIKTIHKTRIKNLLLLLIQVWAIILSASRGTMLFTVLSFFCILCFDYHNKTSRKLLYCFFVFSFIGGFYIITQTTVFSSKEKSNDIKIGHLESFKEYTTEEPSVLLWGRGTGSFYYTKGFDRMAFQTEITFIDMIRYFGLPCTFLFLFIMMFPMKKSIMNIPFIMYFFDATTNPLIFCSTGMLVIALFYLLPEINMLLIPKVTKTNNNKFLYAFLHYNGHL